MKAQIALSLPQTKTLEKFLKRTNKWTLISGEEREAMEDLISQLPESNFPDTEFIEDLDESILKLHIEGLHYIRLHKKANMHPDSLEFLDDIIKLYEQNAEEREINVPLITLPKKGFPKMELTYAELQAIESELIEMRTMQMTNGVMVIERHPQEGFLISILSSKS